MAAKDQGSTGAAPPTTVRLQNVAQSYGQSAALMAAVEIGVFTAIGNGAGTYEEVARAVDIHPANAERLMVMLCAAGLLQTAQGRHTNAPDVERYLVEGKPGYMGPWITFTKPQWNEWGRLSRASRAPRTSRSWARSRPSPWPTRGATTRRPTRSAWGRAAASSARSTFRAAERIMDIGGGSGAYCIAAAKEHAAIRAVVLDLPVVCEVARDFIAANGVADRVEAQACNFTRDPFPADCDVAIMASNLPMYGRDMIASVIRKAHDALLPGGQMHLIGEMTNDQRTGPWGPAYWGLGQAVSDSLGLAHSEADVIGYFRAAGFIDVGLHDFIPGSLGRVTGTKAG